MTAPPDRQELRLLTILATSLVAYDASRAATLSITYDEALTYLWHVTGKVGDIVRLATPGLPDNNHLLLTLSSKFSVWLFGTGEFALRLPSVLGFALFCAAVAAILRRYLHGPLLVLFFLFTTLNPYVIDMMSIARGYGPGIAFATCGTYALMRAWQPEGSRAVWASLSSASFALAVLAHLSLLLFYAVALLVLAMAFVREYLRGEISKRELLRVMAIPALISTLLAPVVIMQVHRLAPLGLLNTEGLTSFYLSSVQPIVTGSLYLRFEARGAAVTAVCLFAYVVPTCGVLLLSLPRRILPLRPAARSDMAILLALLLGVSLLSVVQHHLAGVAYLGNRRALPLFVPFACLCGSIAGACRAGVWPLRRLALPALLVAVLPLTVIFALSANLHKTRDWDFTAGTETMLADLAALHVGTPLHPAHLGISPIFDASTNYYRIRDRLTWLSPVDRSGLLGPFDAYYIFASNLPELEGAIGPVQTLRHYPISDSILAVRQPPPKKP